MVPLARDPPFDGLPTVNLGGPRVQVSQATPHSNE
jgi:hypothetical protein